MRRSTIVLAYLVALTSPGLVAAQAPPVEPPAAVAPPAELGAPLEGRDLAEPEPPATPAEQLDKMFAALKEAKDEDAAKAIEARIQEQFLRSGSDTIDLLMSWAVQAMGEEDSALALDILDQVVVLKPDYAEGWNRRATVLFSKEEFGKSLADIERVLALEPRHFAAITGLGMIMREFGEDELAAAAFRKALEIHPHLTKVRDALETLEKELGRDI